MRNALTLTSLLIEGETIGTDATYFAYVFTLLAEQDPCRIFHSRAVCRSWRDYVDTHLRDVDWGDMCAALVTDQQLRRYLKKKFGHAGSHMLTNMDMQDEYRRLVLGGREGVVCPGMSMILNSLCELSVRSACELQPFSKGFSVDARGWTFYAVYISCRTKSAPQNELHLKHLRRWWREALKEVLRQIEERNAELPAESRPAVRRSVRSFVDKMATVAFFALRAGATRSIADDADAICACSEELLSGWTF